jgi:hypothetical protein
MFTVGQMIQGQCASRPTSGLNGPRRQKGRGLTAPDKSYLHLLVFRLSWAAMIREMVHFKFILMDESKVKPELKEQLLTIGRLVRWDYTDDQGTYTGLIVIGEKAIARGFQTVAKVSLDAATKALPTRKVQELSRLVGNEFLARKLF